MTLNVEDINSKCRMYNLLLKHHGYSYTQTHYSVGKEIAHLYIVLNSEGIPFELERRRYNTPILCFKVGTEKYDVMNPVDFKERYGN